MSDLQICVESTDFPGDIPSRHILPPSAPAILLGQNELLGRQRVTLLNSRQSPRITLHSDWITQTENALQSLDPATTTIITSLGTTAWNYLTWAAARKGFATILVFTGGSAHNFRIARARALMDLGLRDSRVLAMRPLLLTKYKKKAQTNRLRDSWILALAQQVLPVSIRPGGTFDTLLQQINADVATDRRYQIKYNKAPSYRRPSLKANIELPDWYDPDEYLVHWTRSSSGPWPDEAQEEYFRRVTARNYTETGFQTLRQIIRDRRIKASGHLIRGKYEVVPFTARSAADLPKIIQWRAGLRHWTFEPYGIAIRKQLLIEAGAQAVSYGSIDDYEVMNERQRPFFQIAETTKHDWRPEKEWRIAGDVDLGRIEPEGIVVIVHKQSDAQSMNLPKEWRIFNLNH